MVDDALTVWEFRDKRAGDDQIIQRSAEKNGFGGASNPMDIGNLYLERNIQAFIAAMDEGRDFELNGNEVIKAVRLIRRLYADSGLAEA
jgi:hypothetical protein